MAEYTHEVQLPFAGFYCSIHDGEGDRELSYVADLYADAVGEDIPESLLDMFQDAADWGTFHLEYSKAYTEAFLYEYLEGEGEFSGLDSPALYNFSTDRVFARISRKAIAMMWRGTDRDTFERLVRERHTSRDGFISHYRNDWREWGSLRDWDHNQLGTLLLAYCETLRGECWDQWAEYSLVEDLACNGHVHDWIWSGEAAARPWRILDYLRERAQRPPMTMAQWYAANHRPWSTTPLGGYAAWPSP